MADLEAQGPLVSGAGASNMDDLCPHGRPWDDCYEDGGHPTIASGDGSGIDGPLGHPNLAFCHCGSAWFVATVCMEQDGVVTGYSDLRCSECHEVKPLGFTGDHPWQFTTDEWKAERDG